MTTATTQPGSRRLATALISLAAALVLAVAGTAPAHAAARHATKGHHAAHHGHVAPKKQGGGTVADSIHVAAAYVAQANPADTVDQFDGTGLFVNLSLTADDERDTLLLYETNTACAANLTQAENAIDGGAALQVFDEDLDSTSSWAEIGRDTWRVEFQSSIEQQAGDYSTLCAVLFDGPGDPPKIPADHVWTSAQAPIPTGAP